MAKRRKPKAAADVRESTPPWGALPRLTGLVVQGFQSVRDRTELEIRPLTLLAGRNSSGKSSLVRPLLLLKQTIDSPFDPGPLLLDGPNVRLESLRECTWRPVEGSRTRGSFAAGLSFDHASAGLTFTDDPAGGPRVEWRARSPGGLEWALRSDMTDAEAASALGLGRSDGGWSLARIRFQLHVSPRDRPAAGLDGSPLLRHVLLVRDVVETTHHTLHVGSTRHPLDRLFPLTSPGPHFNGWFEDYVGGLLAAWQESGDARSRAVVADMKRLELGTSVRALPRAGGIEVRVGRRHGNGRRAPDDNLVDVGAGVRHGLMTVTALHVARENQVVYVEAPENHLHPQAQVAMARVLLDAARRGVTVIAETHSHLVLRSVLTEVAKDPDLAPLVKLHWVSLGKDGATTVQSADVDEKGTYGEWPEDFYDVETDLDDAYLRASMGWKRAHV